mmetsp:Transcript_4224/g.15545  ORF Transcript_4224/g.15545 Transcript_4224/m.15545 type:complete len:165 (+) Transcript_4224:363-857(+)
MQRPRDVVRREHGGVQLQDYLIFSVIAVISSFLRLPRVLFPTFTSFITAYKVSNRTQALMAGCISLLESWFAISVSSIGLFRGASSDGTQDLRPRSIVFEVTLRIVFGVLVVATFAELRSRYPRSIAVFQLSSSAALSLFTSFIMMTGDVMNYMLLSLSTRILA